MTNTASKSYEIFKQESTLHLIVAIDFSLSCLDIIYPTGKEDPNNQGKLK